MVTKENLVQRLEVDDTSELTFHITQDNKPDTRGLFHRLFFVHTNCLIHFFQ
ncbi:MAG: hypothetical protein ACI8ZB_000980 [Desulforhopalus sp.]|jgi:hypothetical protein